MRSEHANTNWTVRVKAGTPYEALSTPEYWLDLTASLPVIPYDTINAVWADNSMWAQVLVVDCDRSWGAKVVELRKIDFDKSEAKPVEVPPGYLIEWRGMSDKHVIVRKSDGAVIRNGIKRREDAVIALMEHLKTV